MLDLPAEFVTPLTAAPPPPAVTPPLALLLPPEEDWPVLVVPPVDGPPLGAPVPQLERRDSMMTVNAAIFSFIRSAKARALLRLRGREQVCHAMQALENDATRQSRGLIA
jgi:hypothetical protein